MRNTAALALSLSLAGGTLVAQEPTIKISMMGSKPRRTSRFTDAHRVLIRVLRVAEHSLRPA